MGPCSSSTSACMHDQWPNYSSRTLMQSSIGGGDAISAAIGVRQSDDNVQARWSGIWRVRGVFATVLQASLKRAIAPCIPADIDKDVSADHLSTASGNKTAGQHRDAITKAGGCIPTLVEPRTRHLVYDAGDFPCPAMLAAARPNRRRGPACSPLDRRCLQPRCRSCCSWAQQPPQRLHRQT